MVKLSEIPQITTLEGLHAFLATLPHDTTANVPAYDLRVGNFDDVTFYFSDGTQTWVLYNGPAQENAEMTMYQALSLLSDGHSLCSVEVATQICKIFDVEFNAHLILEWGSTQEAYEKYGLIHVDNPIGNGVWLMKLGKYICRAFELNVPSFSGKGFQAQANARALRAHLQFPDRFPIL